MSATIELQQVALCDSELRVRELEDQLDEAHKRTQTEAAEQAKVCGHIWPDADWLGCEISIDNPRGDPSRVLLPARSWRLLCSGAAS